MRKLTFLALMLFATAASAQQIDLKSLDKFFDKAKSKTEINMDESMVKAAAGFLDDKKAEEGLAKKTTEGLKGFFLRSYEFDQPGIFKLDDLKPLLDQLKSPAWTSFLRSKEDNEQTEIWMHRTNGVADGMLLIAAESDEITVINAVGVTRLEDLSKLGDLGKLPQVNSKPAEKQPEPAKK
jgi:Domain of unknown function (DUF4252)